MTTITEPALTWTQTRPREWRTTDGAYVILAVDLPGERLTLTPVYILRWRSPETARGWGDGWLGIPVGHVREHLALVGAKAEAARHAFSIKCARGNTEILDSLPALGAAPFWWWISEGTDRARLIVTRNTAGELVAQVVGMSRGGTASGEYAPAVVAEVNISQITGGRRRRWWAQAMTALRQAWKAE